MADFALTGSFAAPLPPEFREVEPFCLRARSRLFAGPLDPAQDWEQFGKEVSTLEGRLLRLEASIATQLSEAKSFGQL